MIKEILLLSAGIILFLFGMMKLSMTVQQLFTLRIREYIKYAVKKPLYGLLTGIVFRHRALSKQFGDHFLTVGMVSAGMITFYHYLGILLGAESGPRSPFFLSSGNSRICLPFFYEGVSSGFREIQNRWKTIGEAVFYFGLIFFGLSLASLATVPLKDHPAIIRFFQEARNPLLGLVVGILFTGIAMSSAIPISILVILAQNHLMSLEVALPIVFGANVGTTVTALMAGAVADISGREARLPICSSNAAAPCSACCFSPGLLWC